MAVSLYETDDILVQLNAVEIFSEFGGRPYNAEFLSNHRIFASIKNAAFDVKQDLYLRKYSLILVVRLIGNGAVKLTPSIVKDINKVLRELVQSKQMEEVSAGFEIIQSLALRQEVSTQARWVVTSRLTCPLYD